MKQLPVPRDRKRWLRKRQWLLHVADTREGGRAWRKARDESVLFIGTQFSILYTSMYSPAGAGTLKG